MVYKDPNYVKKYRIKNRKRLKENWKKWYKKNKERVSKNGKIRRKQLMEQNPEIVKQWKRNYYLKHKPYVDKKNREYYEKNKDSILKKRKEWFKNNKDKITLSKRRGSRKRRSILNNIIELFTQEEWEEKLKLYSNICPSCGKTNKLTLDHIYPISKANIEYMVKLFNENYISFPMVYTIDDIQPLCRSCNSTKGGKRKWVVL